MTWQLVRTTDRVFESLLRARRSQLPVRMDATFAIPVTGEAPTGAGQMPLAGHVCFACAPGELPWPAVVMEQVRYRSVRHG